MLNETFSFRGKRANSMGIELQDSIIITATSPKFNQHIVPGRNGTIYDPDGAYEDRSIIASCYLLSHVLERDIDAINAWLISSPGYHRFEDSQDPYHFMMAYAKSGIEKHARGGILAPFSLEFSAKPQRFLKLGEKPISITSNSAIIKNPTKYAALPLIEFNGSGYFEIEIGGNTLKFLGVNNETVIYDAELDTAYSGSQSMDQKVGSTGQIVLSPGSTEVKFTLINGNVYSLKITPRWWEI